MNREHIEWKELPMEAEHYTYWISNYGDLKRSKGDFTDKAGRHLVYPEKTFWSEEQANVDGSGAKRKYKGVNINGTRYYSHRLAASVFISNQDDKPEVNHKDGNPQNNYCGCKEYNYLDSNLEWVTKKENMVHASRNGLVNRDSPLRKNVCKKNREKIDINKHKKPIYQLTILGEPVQLYPSIKNAATATGITITTISAVLRKVGHHKTAGGYFWIYADEYDPNANNSIKIDRGQGARKSILQYDLDH